MISIAERGLECGQLLQWEAMALKMQVLQSEGRALTAEGRLEAAEAVRARKAEMTCDDTGLTTYIEGARPGIEREILPPFLVIYHALASLEERPAAFTAAAPRLDYRSPIAHIDAKLAELEAKGYAPEGGGSWEDYRTRLSGTIIDAMNLPESGESVSPRTLEVLSYISMSGIVVEAWLADIQAQAEQE